MRAIVTSQSALGSLESLAGVGRKPCSRRRPSAPVATQGSTPMASARSTCFPLAWPLSASTASARPSSAGIDSSPATSRSAVVEYERDTDLRDTERMPLTEAGGIDAFLHREVLPYAAAWYQPDRVNVGYEISFTRYY